jgi:hypothetical protein
LTQTIPELFGGGVCAFADVAEVVVFEEEGLEAGVLEVEVLDDDEAEADAVASFEDASVFGLAVFLAALESVWL